VDSQGSIQRWFYKDTKAKEGAGILAHKLTLVFKFVEPLFWLAQVWMVADLFKPRFFFKSNLKFINFLLRCQGFDTQLPFAEKAFKTWHRDIWILCFLNILVIVLIHLI